MSNLASEITIMDAEAIRDTNDHNSSSEEIRGFVPKTMGIITTLDEDLNIQLQGCMDGSFTTPFDIGNPQTFSGNDYIVLTDYFPFIRAVASCDPAPTTGALTIILAKVE